MKRQGFTLVELLIALFIIVLICLTPVFAIWTDRTLEFWLSMIKKEAVEVPYWISFLTTVVCNAFIMALNLVSEIIRLVI